MSRSIFVADDSYEMQVLLEKLLEFEGTEWAITSASDGNQAVDLFAGPYDFVLLDFRMPGRDGLEVAQEVRRRGYAGPVVVWSSAGIGIPLNRAEALQVTVLDKFEIQKLMEMLRSVAEGPDGLG